MNGKGVTFLNMFQRVRESWRNADGCFAFKLLQQSKTIRKADDDEG